MQGTNLYIRSNLGFSVLLKDTLTLTLGDQPATLPLTHCQLRQRFIMFIIMFINLYVTGN